VIRSFPELPLWMALSAALPVTWDPLWIYFGITIILGLIDWTGLARAVRSKILALREEDFATAALLIYAVLLFALIKLIPITLTLPGIAGMVLTLAVAADANIVMYERIKEEVRGGRSVPAAISAGYAKALRTIIDANRPKLSAWIMPKLT